MTTPTRQPTANSPLDLRHSTFPFRLWPAALIAYFIVFISFIVAFIVFASRQQMDLVHPDYYQEEILYQQQVDRLNRTRALGAGVAIAFDANLQAVTITLPAAHARRPTSGRIHFYRPSDASLDRDIQLAVNADGVQRVDAKRLRAGLWKVRMEWKVGGEEFQMDQPIFVISPPS